MKTRAELINRVLMILGEDGGAGQPSQPESVAKVNDALPGVLDELREREVVDIDPDHVPDALYTALAIIVANNVAHDFGLGTDEMNVLAQRYVAAESTIRSVVWQPADSPVMRVSYF